ncbi:hypothetical protein NOC27_119 [Nitrosococcus oceani AFC27]|uniref:hypothetical protein n=1 Tax=Nitrosococcus oceani TaxID=1229 RepID=UPI000183C9EF|nr:hypothetical protein [Nitrosococcus oceani]EDZ66792.1 hypothetical protein NOC27_119 [Nitrosococcus oceani AFC27]
MSYWPALYYPGPADGQGLQRLVDFALVHKDHCLNCPSIAAFSWVSLALVVAIILNP